MFTLRVDGAIRTLQERPGSLPAARHRQSATTEQARSSTDLARLGGELQTQIGRFRS